MFNLLVSGAGWAPNRDSIHRGRVLEYTAAHVMQMYLVNDALDLRAVTEIPTLFVNETGGLGEEIARVGYIRRVRLTGGEYHIEYVLDAEVEGVPNARLEAIADVLAIERYEFRRTHWAIKDVDLFEVMLKHGNVQRASPKLFQVPNEPVEEDLVAVMMPFAKTFDATYEAIKSAAELLDMRCQRGDEIWENDVVIQDIAALLARARVVICDLTGRNANVFYEMGIAHTLGKDTILIAQSAQDVPFDVNHIRHLRYLDNDEGRGQLEVELVRRLRTLTGRDVE